MLVKGDLVCIRLPGTPWQQWKRTAIGRVVAVGAGCYTVHVVNTAEAGKEDQLKKRKRQCPFDTGKTYTVPHVDCGSVYTHPKKWRK